jgi:hypothetical protein
VVVAVTDGKLDFGPWERTFYAEFDGRRRKRLPNKKAEPFSNPASYSNTVGR